MGHQPAISLIVPCKNEGPLVAEAIHSVLSQRVAAPFEIVVVNDRVDHAETLSALADLRAHPRVRILANRGSLGPAGARNAGVEASHGTWIGFLDADDLLLSGSLQRRWGVARDRGTSVFVAGDFLEKALDGSVRGWVERFGDIDDVEEQLSQIGESRRTDSVSRIADPLPLILWGVIRTPTILMPRSVFLEAGGFDESLRIGEDLHLWMRIASRADLMFINEPLAVYRRRGGSLTLGADHPAVEGRKATRLLLKDPEFRAIRPLLRRRLARMDRALMWHYRNTRDRRRALMAAASAVRWAPFRLATWRNVVGTVLGR